MKKTTIFVITTDEPSFEECKQRLESQMDSTMCLKVISNTFPMWRAFQRMLDECETPFFIQVDADMLLEGHAISSLVSRIEAESSNVAIVTDWLWDLDVERPILGVKIYKHSICVNFPYEDSVSCEMTQLEGMKKHGYELKVSDLPKTKETCLGVHFPSQTPEMAFRRWERNMMKMRKLPWMDWLSVYPSRIIKQMFSNPEDHILRAKAFGIMSGLSVSLVEDTEADYSKPNENFTRYSQYFYTTTTATFDFVVTQNESSQKRFLDEFKALIQKEGALKLDTLKLEKNTDTDTFEIRMKFIFIENTIGCPTGFINTADIDQKYQRDFGNESKRKQNLEDAWFRQELISFFVSFFNKNKTPVNLQNSIVFCVDRFDWAFDHISKQVIKHSKKQNKGYDLYRNDAVFICFLGKLFDLKTNIICFWWKSFALLEASLPNAKISLTLYDHYSWTHGDDSKKFKDYLKKASCIGVGNKRLKASMQNLNITEKIFLVQDGVDFELFPLSNRNVEKPTFGWVGNSKIQKLGGYSGDDLKGIKIIKDACAKMNVDLKLFDVSENPPIAQHLMFDEFYSKIDCYICASDSEGTPNTIFESLACGIPVISTNVGNVEDVLVSGINGFFFDRSQKGLENVLKEYLKKHENLSRDRQQIRDSVAFFEWGVKAQSWFVFLNYILSIK